MTCPTCGAPPRRGDEKRAVEEEVRTEDLEPYITLRYIAKLFKVLAVVMFIMLIAGIVAGISSSDALSTIIGETTYMLVLAGFMWAGGDLTLLLIDAGHDLRVARILLGRINAELHRRADEETRVSS
ncbi:MAG TPA: hypothetical protein VNA69_21025 [Thermoanaerobaculia bacterium]|nr:hypothetical protein [Thermoanaerobaculia bacterium]